ncbi:NB-ARC domain-containing protein [Frankia torreyi]|uniref:NB-ARC domain-containing protein n=1 Tax=Frankia torreyi TaxID=1856 RepID=A0A0D8B9R3_9ACTN|nr:MULTISPECIES: FxSxx-COOH system tetratricopeptide repeat protein [Frankia]KJE20835.1 NB-ARC domain-containing protein [Frankia torreyi]
MTRRHADNGHADNGHADDDGTDGLTAGDQPDKPSRVRYLPGPVHIDLAPAIRDERALARALHPLVDQVPAPQSRPLDTQRTARDLLQSRMGQVTVKGSAPPRWELALVVDANPTFFAAWGDALPGIIQILERQLAFRDVIVAYLVPDDRHDGALRLRGGPASSTTRPPSQLTERTGRRVIWLLTDGLGEAWRSGRMAQVLAEWADAGPVAVIDVLASRTWDHTDLDAERVRLHGSGFGTGRVRSWTYQGGLLDQAGDDPDHGVEGVEGDRAAAAGSVAGSARTARAVPVLELDAEWIGYWARFVAAAEPTWFETVAVVAGSDRRFPPEYGIESSPPDERLEDFFALATPTSRKLAGLLAIQPLSRRSLRTVAGIAGASRRDLSEIFAFGLLVIDSLSTTFDIIPEIRSKLRAQVSRSDVERIRRAVGSDADNAGTEPLGMPMATPSDQPPVRPPGEADTPAPVWDAAAPLDRTPSARPPRSTGAPAGEPRPPRTPDTESEDSLTMSSIAGTSRPRSSAGDGSMGAAGAEANTTRGGPTVTVGTALRPALAAGQLPRVWGNVPPRNPHFTGRVDLLTMLDARLLEGTTSVLPETLHGMGGVGKSQLATEYIYRHLSDFDIIWWIPAERTVQISSALIELGARLGLDVGTEANVAVRQVVEALRIGHPYERWLLVFDNADDPQAVREYFPASPTGRVLVTSRNPGWANVSHPLEVAVFRREESVALLRSRGGPLDDDGADQVASALGDLPLAVEQAATWRAETGMSAQEYLRLLEDKLTELLSTAPADYPRPVTAAWNVSLDRLAESNPAALELLQVCAFFAPEPISRQLLSRAHNETISPALDEALRDPVKLGQAIRDINRYALARINHRDNSIVMHRLVQAVLIGRMTPDQQRTMRHGAHVLLAASDPNDPFNPGLWPTYADLYPHMIASLAERSADPRVRQLLLNEVDYLWTWGDHQVSNDLARGVHAEWQASFGEDDPYTLQMALRSGWGLVVIGRYAEAAEVNRRTFELSTQVNGPDGELTIVLMGNVAADLRWRGDFAAAYDVAEDAYRRARQAFGADDPQTLDAAHNVAVSLRLLGRFAESAELAEDTWQRSIQLYGENHDRSLNTFTGLTLDRRELGDYLGARATQENIDARYRHLFKDSENHPARLHAGRNLAVAHRKAGDHDKALALSRDVEERFFHRYGGEHPASLAAALSLSIDLRHAGQLHEARKICVRTQQRYATKIGEMHPHTLATWINLAIIDRLSGQSDVALDRDERTLAAFVERLGDRHPSTLACAANLASDLYAVGRFEEAHARDQVTLATSTEVLGEAHPTTLAVAANLAMDLRALERKEEALELQAATLTRLDRVLGHDHPATRQVVAGIRLDCDVDPMPM